MTPNELAELKDDETLRKRLAKFLARECFRNSRKLEEMHTEGKIGQEDMKELMIEVSSLPWLFSLGGAMSGVQGGRCHSDNAMILLMNFRRPFTCRVYMRYVEAYVVPDVVPDVARGPTGRSLRGAVLSKFWSSSRVPTQTAEGKF
jgi:hypothetical protein